MKLFIDSGKPMPWSKVFITGILVGTLDIGLAFLSAYIQKGTLPEKILQYIASGVFGRDAFAVGGGYAIWGLVFHYIIATCFTILIFLFFRYGLFPIKNKWITGILAGIAIWAVMQYVVVPLSQVPTPKVKPPVNLVSYLRAAVILIAAIGLPASLIANQHFNSRHVNTAYK